jgi:hypothetical protein
VLWGYRVTNYEGYLRKLPRRIIRPSIHSATVTPPPGSMYRWFKRDLITPYFHSSPSSDLRCTWNRTPSSKCYTLDLVHSSTSTWSLPAILATGETHHESHIPEPWRVTILQTASQCGGSMACAKMPSPGSATLWVGRAAQHWPSKL